MKLRTYLLSTAGVVVGIVLAVFAFQTRGVIDDGAHRVAEAQNRQLSEIVRGAVRARFSVLRNFNRVLRADNDLSGAFLLASETKDLHQIESKLAKVRENGGFDVAEIVSFLHASDLSPQIQAAKDAKEGLAIVESQGKRTLIYYSPIEHYGSPVGALLIGYRLDGSIKTELESLTQSSIDLRTADGSEKDQASPADVRLVIPGSQRQSIVAHIVPKERIADDIGTRVIGGILIAGALCLALLIVLFYLVLELGFVRRFRLLALHAEELANAVSRGETPEYEPSRSRIRENRILNRVLERFASSIREYQKKIEEKAVVEVEAKRQQALAEMAQDVAHHIRSPLVAAENAIPMLIGVPDDTRRVLSNAVREIRVLTDELKAQADRGRITSVPLPTVLMPTARLKEEKLSLQHIYSLIDHVVSKKRMELQQCPGIEIIADLTDGSYPLFASVQVTELRIALSNLINNAVDAYPDSRGIVTVTCRVHGDRVQIAVSDAGRGIAKELIPQLGKRGFTFGKLGGSGIGLAHARFVVEKFGGSLTIISEEGRGTEVTLDIPRAPTPEWFINELRLTENGTIVILDDDQSIHDLWNLRFKSCGLSIATSRIVHFNQADEFASWVGQVSPQSRPVTYLLDFELLGQEKNGLNLIEELRIAQNSILVSGRFDEEAVTARVLWLGIKMIPKPLVGVVPIHFARSEPTVSAAQVEANI